MDLTAEFYLQTVDTVFIQHSLPKGTMTHRGRLVDTTKITRVALLTVEGENDDISGVGQTNAAHTICTSIPASKRMHYMQPDVGHYGVFNGSRFRKEIAPRILKFMADNQGTETATQEPVGKPARQGTRVAKASPARKKASSAQIA
jgi:poly(3-hydroxybutyrate) depolymerase